MARPNPPLMRLSAPLRLASLETFAGLAAPVAEPPVVWLGNNDTLTPAVMTRNILYNAVWYTSYTPSHAEISQSHRESLLNYQTTSAT